MTIIKKYKWGIVLLVSYSALLCGITKVIIDRRSDQLQNENVRLSNEVNRLKSELDIEKKSSCGKDEKMRVLKLKIDRIENNKRSEAIVEIRKQKSSLMGTNPSSLFVRQIHEKEINITRLNVDENAGGVLKK